MLPKSHVSIDFKLTISPTWLLPLRPILKSLFWTTDKSFAMTVRFGNHRLAFYSKLRLVDHRCNRISSQHLCSWGFCIIRYCRQCEDIRFSQTDFCISGVVLGIAANFANVFFPNFHRECLLDCAWRTNHKIEVSRWLHHFCAYYPVPHDLHIPSNVS